MTQNHDRHAAVVGSGPNGLAAAITLARSGYTVTVFEKNSNPGGACRSGDFENTGNVYDLGSAIHPLAVNSPFFRKLPLNDHGLTWVYPEIAVAHPFDDGTAMALHGSPATTADSLDHIDRISYQKLMNPLVSQVKKLVDEVTHFPVIPPHHPLLMMKFGLRAVHSVSGLADKYFKGNRARAFWTGLGIHSVMDPDSPGSAAAGLVLAAAGHFTGWPFPAGGAQKLTDALSGYLETLGGTIQLETEILSLDELKEFSPVLLDVTPWQFSSLAGNSISEPVVKRIEKYSYGPGIFKIDWLLKETVPWQADECRRAGTVHIGGSFEEMVASEKDAIQGIHPERPFVLLAQPSLFDTSRLRGKEQILWGYCHVPAGSTRDMTKNIEDQIERFAPGFREIIISRKVTNTVQLEQENPNCIRGDITGGSQSLKKLLMPEITVRTPLDNVFLCSSSITPGPGVHGMNGYRAALSALKSQGIHPES